MDKFIINGPTPLNGDISISGSKNAALPILTACLAFPGIYTLKNVPDLRDTRTMLRLLEIIGCQISKESESIVINSINCNNPEAPYELVKTMRASFYVLGPLLSRFNYAKVSLPGGCAWGPRPIDYHLTAFEELGANIDLDSGYIITEGSLSSAKIRFPKPSVGATGNVIMACSSLEEEVTIENAAMEPEISDLCHFLSKAGVSFDGIGTATLKIKGIRHKNPINVKYTVIPDRIEAGTFLIAGAMNGGRIRLNNVKARHLDNVIENLIKCGSKIEVLKNSIIIDSDKNISPVDLSTDVYPGYPTDLQAQWIALMCIADGKSVIKDTVYLDRFTHVPELIRLGAKIRMDKNIAIIQGVNQLKSAKIMSTDIRASASLIIAAMNSEGQTHLSRIYHIDRGYEKIEEKLNNVGASIKRINE